MLDTFEWRVKLAELEADEYGGIYKEILENIKKRTDNTRQLPETRRTMELRGMTNDTLRQLCESKGLKCGSPSSRWPSYKIVEVIIAHEFPNSE